MGALDKKINSRTAWFQKPYVYKKKDKDKGQSQGKDQNKQYESANKSEKAKEEGRLETPDQHQALKMIT